MLDIFTEAYIECAIWASHDENGNSLEYLNFGVDDLSPDTLKQIEEDCRLFQEAHYGLIQKHLAQAGHDFFLTRNRIAKAFEESWAHGVGKKLNDSARACGTFELYVGDDGLLYHHG